MLTKKKPTKPTPHQSNKTKQPLSAEEFVVLWQKSTCLADMAEAAGTTKRAAIYRAAHLRQKGVRLKRFKSRNEKVDVDRLNEIVRKTEK